MNDDDWLFEARRRPIKTAEEVDAIMESIVPSSFRYRWCGAEFGPCACLGCVQICSRALMYELQTGQKLRSDPEGIPLQAIRPDIREACTISREEWEAWKVRNPQSPEDARASRYQIYPTKGVGIKVYQTKGADQ